MTDELAEDHAEHQADGAAVERALAVAQGHGDLSPAEAATLMGATGEHLESLLQLAGTLRDSGLEMHGRGRVISYSRKVFVPITTLCRDRCHYCTFVDTPGSLRATGRSPYLTADQILEIAADGAEAGCKEALFTLGDRPELRWKVAREWLESHGYESTLEYVAAMAAMVRERTGLLVHLNPGVMTWGELQLLRPHAASMGMMLETTSEALFSLPGGAHFGSPDKEPALRLQVLEDAGRSRIPFTTGLLIGIGENCHDRAASLFAIRDSHARWGQIQETIIQNFRAKPRTAMQDTRDLAADEYLAAIAVARLVMGPTAHIQAPPNLSDPAELGMLIKAGIDDWGGVSPVTPDHVNPERPWPQIDFLAEETNNAGYLLRERLTVQPEWVLEGSEWIDSIHLPEIEAKAETSGLAATLDGDTSRSRELRQQGALHQAIEQVTDDPDTASSEAWATLLTARGAELDELASVADARRSTQSSGPVTYVVNQNLDASRWDPLGRRGGLTAQDISTLAHDAVASGATEICVQGLIHPSESRDGYLNLIATIREAEPTIHIHGFRPAELLDGAKRTNASLESYLARLRAAGLGTVPGTGAFILDDRLRASLGVDDVSVAMWKRTLLAAHRSGLKSTATIVTGHGETPSQIMSHLQALKTLHREESGFTELIPMPWILADSRPLPTAHARHRILDRSRAVTAVARLFLGDDIPHIQAAWPKLGIADAAQLLSGGADDIGGVLLPPSLPEAGSEAGRFLTSAHAEVIDSRARRGFQQRDTTYQLIGRAGFRHAATTQAPAASSQIRQLLASMS